jgi:NitT/TauT family transport system substrate-binding protein
MLRPSFLRAAGAASVAAAFGSPSAVRAQTASNVTIGSALAVTDAPLFIAAEMGYFREAGITPVLQDFSSGATLIASLGAGQLDVGGGSVSAGLFNAVSRGIAIKIVADRGASKPGYGFVQLLVRKELIVSGKFKSLADLKGLRVAESGKGAANLCQISKALESVGLSYADVQHVFLSPPDQITALGNGSIDATMLAEPYATLAKNLGVCTSFSGTDKFYPNQETSVILYNGQFATQRADVAKAFMFAYLRGQRHFLDAFRGAHLTGPGSDEIVGILNRRLKIDPAVLRAMVLPYPDPDGRVNVAALNDDLTIYRAEKLIDGTPSVEQTVDASFASAAATRLGRYRRKA